MKDLFGQAILDYQLGNYTEDLVTETSISEPDTLSVPYLYRDYQQMPLIEQKALDLAKGQVLDLGCGAGSHSLYLQNTLRLDVTSVDISPKAIEACKLRGLKDTWCGNLFDLDTSKKYDTILLLMNGAGMCAKMDRFETFLNHLKALLAPNGQILLDSSDIIYMYEDEDGGYWLDANATYYGELTFYVSYKNEQEAPFDWLYIDYNNLKEKAEKCGLNCELTVEGTHFDYLARLTF